MLNLTLEFPEKFFEGEERCGHYVSPEIKKVWAVELDLLHQFMTVCDQHDIQYFAGGGTLLGAARHQGFIPWDDDIDIHLKRSEYERFVEIARAGAFQPPYFWQDLITDPSYLGGPGRLQNTDTTGFAYGALREKNGIVTDRLGIYIDIFPMDNMPDEEDERERWLQRIGKLSRKAWDLRMYAKRGLLQDRADLEWLNFYLQMKGTPNELFEQYYNLLAANAHEQTRQSCIFSFYCRGRSERWVYDNADLQQFTRLPFEMLSLPVPADYDKVLTHDFGDWHQFVKGTSEHDKRDIGLFFDVDHPYTYYVDPVKGIRKELVK